MKRKLLPVLALAGSLFFTACQENELLDEAIQDTESTGGTNSNGGSPDAIPGENN